MSHRLTIIALGLGLLASPIGLATWTNAAAEETKSILDQKTYLLRYKLTAGETIGYEVTHVAKTKTRIVGQEDVSQVHTVSQRHWDVQAPTPSGDMQFDHIVDSVEMTQQQGDKDEIRWDSRTGEDPPREFRGIAEQMGTKLATLTINARGEEIAREDHGGTKASLGMGTLTLTLPADAIAIGASWSVPREAKARNEAGEVIPIKIRELYTLEKVQTGVATIRIKSEPLTPIDGESIRAQVVQQLSNGQLRFDVDNGRMLSKQLDWDETVVGFQGANSMLEYRSRMTETLVESAPRTAKKP